jgi:hypothetical protein
MYLVMLIGLRSLIAAMAVQFKPRQNFLGKLLRNIPAERKDLRVPGSAKGLNNGISPQCLSTLPKFLFFPPPEIFCRKRYRQSKESFMNL